MRENNMINENMPDNNTSDNTNAMMAIDAYQDMAEELLDELPEELLRGLNLGIVVIDSLEIHPQSVHNDLYIMGRYERSAMGRGIQLFYRSFARVFGTLPPQVQKDELRKIMRHELRHHWEWQSGDDTLGEQDRWEIEEYLRQRGKR